MILPGLGIFKWRNHLEKFVVVVFFLGIVFLADGWGQGCLSARAGPGASGMQLSEQGAGSALQLPLQTLYYCPFLHPDHEEQAGAAELKQESLSNWNISMCRSGLKGL